MIANGCSMGCLSRCGAMHKLRIATFVLPGGGGGSDSGSDTDKNNELLEVQLPLLSSTPPPPLTLDVFLSHLTLHPSLER